ncbi:MAG: hypothetical protein ACE5K2_06525, partial [Candidatus Zixiibacteriota bacterium]
MKPVRLRRIRRIFFVSFCDHHLFAKHPRISEMKLLWDVMPIILYPYNRIPNFPFDKPYFSYWFFSKRVANAKAGEKFLYP